MHSVIGMSGRSIAVLRSLYHTTFDDIAITVETDGLVKYCISFDPYLQPVALGLALGDAVRSAVLYVALLVHDLVQT